MAYVLTEQQIFEFQEAFCLFDKDGDGRITIEELEKVIKCLVQHPTKQELESMIKDYDVNGNEMLELGEFLNLMARKMKEAEVEDELQDAFKVFDKGSDGYISPQELKHVMISLGAKLTEEELQEMVRVADVDGDGQINFDEFVRMMLAV
ncbi:hypothetical protein Syun_031710 [Stephania yunnanensis]|uniref:EF-hand domain-containing protein n=1 Tax=Stephania yunnanensis TaxID=152371 RepID=A0AAP0E006_9MAGN